jgi:hypothetical protein
MENRRASAIGRVLTSLSAIIVTIDAQLLRRTGIA